jgi:hypothetical protein
VHGWELMDEYQSMRYSIIFLYFSYTPNQKGADILGTIYPNGSVSPGPPRHLETYENIFFENSKSSELL